MANLSESFLDARRGAMWDQQLGRGEEQARLKTTANNNKLSNNSGSPAQCQRLSRRASAIDSGSSAGQRQ